jgi:hypothetical protein
MRRIVAALLTAGTLLLTGCGSAAGPQDDDFKNECINNGGTYTDYETDGDTCTYDNSH